MSQNWITVMTLKYSSDKINCSDNAFENVVKELL